jgi:acyl-CoA oxidase
LLNSLCQQLRPHALSLVDGFAIPDEVLAAPIATGAER